MKCTATKKPTEIKILGFQYTIKWIDECSAGENLGWCDTTALTISIVANQPNTALANTFLHEVIHAVNYSMNIDSGDEEKLTNRLANGLCSVWSENPRVWAWWSSLFKPIKNK